MRILAVDDEQNQLNHLENLITEVCQNAETHCYRKPSEALAFAKENPCDIALLDIQMGGMNGVVLAKHLKELKPDINIIFCTGYSEYAMEAIKLHVSGYLMKPIGIEELKRELEALRHPVELPIKKRIFIQTFGNFEVFCDGKLIDFNRSKSKEVLAYLVDRQGTGASSVEIATVIWEDGQFGISRKKQLQTIISDMRKSLRKVNAEDIIIKNKTGLLIDKTKVECDMYRLLDGDSSMMNRYCGKYMDAYEWAVFTSSYLERVFG